MSVPNYGLIRAYDNHAAAVTAWNMIANNDKLVIYEVVVNAFGSNQHLNPSRKTHAWVILPDLGQQPVGP